MGIASAPEPTTYHRLVGWHAPRLRRLMVVAGVGVIVAIVMLPMIGPELALLAGWDLAAVLFLVSSWLVIIRANGAQTEQLANVTDETRQTATIIVLIASVASLVAVGVTLRVAGEQQGVEQASSIVGAVVTVVVSWSAVNTMFALRYADHYYRTSRGVDFGYQDPSERPDYRDFAYLAFTIGMCYQVSDTTLRNRHIRRIVLVHAIVSYAFGVVIIAAGINLIAALLN